MVPELEQWSTSPTCTKPKQNGGALSRKKTKYATADSTPGTNVLSPAQTHCIWAPWCQNTREFWDGGFGATVSHLMVPELEQRSATPARSAGRKNESIFILLSKK
jgi:hypothetical protein